MAMTPSQLSIIVKSQGVEKAAQDLAKKESELQKLTVDFEKISAIDVDGNVATAQEQLILAKQRRVQWQESVST